MSLIEIGVRQAASAGCRQVVVVTGHEAQAVEHELADLAERLPVEIRTVRLDDWSRPNGWSVISGAEGIEGPFLLMMADHIFADGILSQLARQSLGKQHVVLATDRIDNPLIDPDDATWVACEKGGRITWIGKQIETYDAVDCGAFLTNRELPAAIQHAISQGRPGSLSDGMQVLADRGLAKAWDIGGAWWIDVDDPRAHDLAQGQASRHLAILDAAGAHAD